MYWGYKLGKTMSPHLQWCMFLPLATSHPVQRHAECLIILWRFNHEKNQKRSPPSCNWPQTESTAGIYVENRQGREGTDFRNDWGDNDIWAQPQGSWPAESEGKVTQVTFLGFKGLRTWRTGLLQKNHQSEDKTKRVEDVAQCWPTRHKTQHSTSKFT